MLFSILKKINLKGKLDIVDSNNKTHSFGNSNLDNTYVKIRFTNKKIERNVFINPSLHIGEGYMNGEILIEKGTLEDFINIISSSYDNFISNNLIFRYYEFFSNILKPFQQLNKIIKSKKNVAHHYDLNEDLYRLF